MFGFKRDTVELDRVPTEAPAASVTTGEGQTGPSATASAVRRHTNPDGTQGGWVAVTASVSPDAWVGPRAVVTGYATVAGGSWVEDSAVVGDHATVGAGALIKDQAHLGGSCRVERATVAGDSRVGGNALVNGGAHLAGQARVQGDARVTGPAVIEGDAVVTEAAWVRGGSIFGAAMVAGTHIIEEGMTLDGTGPYHPKARGRSTFGSLPRVAVPA